MDVEEIERSGVSAALHELYARDAAEPLPEALADLLADIDRADLARN